MNQVLINLGCGGRFHRDWQNFDLYPSAPEVRQCDLAKGVPLPANYGDAVFNSALLEHLSPATGRAFLLECHRILKPGGILRIGIPDMERIARTYLNELERSVTGDRAAEANYDWMMLELIDQMVRSRSGGAMGEAIKAGAPNEAFIEQRIGHEFTAMRAAFKAGDHGKLARLRAMDPTERRHKVLRQLRQIPGIIRRAIAGLFLSRADRAALQLGRFRQSGEVHLWMYDRFSLARLMVQAGFREPRVKVAGQSDIPDWVRFGLDVDSTGAPIKPDLLYVECLK
ncbi:MAG: methyltransferase domain-containing protein [Opitutus sp.]